MLRDEWNGTLPPEKSCSGKAGPVLTARRRPPIIARRRMKLFISDFTGLCNRLEALAFAYVIRDHFGHQIILDWPELDSFHVNTTRRGPMRLWHHPGSIKLRDCDAATFQSLGRRRIIALRGLTGAPPAEIARAALKVAGDLRLAPPLARAVRELFLPAQKTGRNVVGVHFRRGDFQGEDLPVFDTTRKYAAVPDWWFRWAMEQIRAARPDTLFYIAGTGDPGALPWLADFDCLVLPAPSPYTYKGPTHASAADPAGELVALASCPALLATPGSSFSHWAANILGSPSQVFLPAPMTRQEAPEMIQLNHRCTVYAEWVAATRTAPVIVPAKLDGALPWAQVPRTDWISLEN